MTVPVLSAWITDLAIQIEKMTSEQVAVFQYLCGEAASAFELA